MAALPDSPLISVEEYLESSYDPDMEFVDGTLVERNMGDWLHSLVQSNILFFLRQKYPHLKVVPELRSRVTTTRYRLPDVVCSSQLQKQNTFSTAPIWSSKFSPKETS